MPEAGAVAWQAAEPFDTVVEGAAVAKSEDLTEDLVVKEAVAVPSLALAQPAPLPELVRVPVLPRAGSRTALEPGDPVRMAAKASRHLHLETARAAAFAGQVVSLGHPLEPDRPFQTLVVAPVDLLSGEVTRRLRTPRCPVGATADAPAVLTAAPADRVQVLVMRRRSLWAGAASPGQGVRAARRVQAGRDVKLTRSVSKPSLGQLRPRSAAELGRDAVASPDAPPRQVDAQVLAEAEAVP